MFAPTKTWRRWHRCININQRRYAMCSAIAATGVPALVMSKGMYLYLIAVDDLCPKLLTEKWKSIISCMLIYMWNVVTCNRSWIRSVLFVTYLPSYAIFVQGHRIEETPEVPLVLSDKVEELKKTKEAVGVLRKLKAWDDIEKVTQCLSSLHNFELSQWMGNVTDSIGLKMMIFLFRSVLMTKEWIELKIWFIPVTIKFCLV